MHKLARHLYIALAAANILFITPAEAAGPGPRTGFTASYFTGVSALKDVGGFNTPASNGYQIGYQGDSLGITFGQNTLGGFTTTGGTFTSNVDVDSNELLLNYRIRNEGTSIMFYAGLSNWSFTNTTQLSRNATSGTSPVAGIGFKLGDNLGLLMTAMYYKDITDSDVISFNAGINF